MWVGLSRRTNASGAQQLAELLTPLGVGVVCVPVSRVLHLKSAVTALPDGTIVGFEPLVDDLDVWPAFVPVPEEAGAHVVVLDPSTVLMSRARRPRERCSSPEGSGWSQSTSPNTRRYGGRTDGARWRPADAAHTVRLRFEIGTGRGGVCRRFLGIFHPLCQGPVVDDPAWLTLRAAYIASGYGEWVGRSLAQIPTAWRRRNRICPRRHNVTIVLSCGSSMTATIN